MPGADHRATDVARGTTQTDSIRGVALWDRLSAGLCFVRLLLGPLWRARQPDVSHWGRFSSRSVTLAGLYAVNFLVIALAVMLPVDTLSGEIASGVMQTLASKPVRRAEIVIGKWLVYWVLLAAYS